MAHLVEHLLFGGSRNLKSGEYVRTIETLGGRFSASTGYEHVSLSSEAPADALESLLWMEADRLFTFAEKVTQLAIDTEASAIAHEHAFRLDSDPFGGWFEVALPLLLGAGNPYGRPAVGDPSAIRNVAPHDVANFMERQIGPSAIIVAIAGAIEEGFALEATTHYFGDTSNGEVPERLAITQKTSNARTTVHLPLRRGSALRVLFCLPSHNDPTFIAAWLASEALCIQLQQNAMTAGGHISVRLQVRPLFDQWSLASISITSPTAGMSDLFARLFSDTWCMIEQRALPRNTWDEAHRKLVVDHHRSLHNLSDRAAAMSRMASTGGVATRGSQLVELRRDSAVEDGSAWFESAPQVLVLPGD